MEYLALVDLFSEMEKFHPNLYQNISKTEFLKELNKLKPVFNKLNEFEQNYEMLRLNALFKDSHTWPFITIKENVAYPYKIKRLNKKYYISNLIKNKLNEKFIFGELIAINDIPVTEIEQRLIPIITSECLEGKFYRICSYMTYPVLLKMIKVTNKDNIKITINQNNEIFNVIVEPVIWDNKDSLIKQPKNKYIFKTYKYYNYFKINTFDGLYPFSKSKHIVNFNKRISLRLQNKKPLIVDLRDNQGGTTYSWVFPLILDTIEKQNIKGYCLINNYSHSSAILMATDLKDKGFVLVGENGGQPSSFYAMGKPIKTSQYGIRFNVSKELCRVDTKNFIPLENSPLKVDVEIIQTINDLKLNKDTVLKYCKDAIKSVL